MLSLLLQADSSTGDGDVSDGTSYFGVERHVWAWGIGTGFALSALLISGALLIQTWRLNPLPLIRRWVLLVLLMVPIYSVFAWLGLVLKNQSAYWDLVRECYEAVALWAFFEFLTAYLGGGQHMAGVLEKKPDYHHIIPFCCLPTWKMHRQFYTNTRLSADTHAHTQPCIYSLCGTTRLSASLALPLPSPALPCLCVAVG